MSFPPGYSRQRAHEKNMKGLALLQQGDYEGALAAFDEAVALDPWDGYIILNRAKAYWKLTGGAEANADPETIAKSGSPDLASSPVSSVQSGWLTRYSKQYRVAPP